MKIYDLDKDLNKLLNEPGMHDALIEYGNKFFWSRLLGYIPIALLVVVVLISTFCIRCYPILFSIFVLILIFVFMFRISYLMKRGIEKYFFANISYINNNIYQKMYNERHRYNWEYLTYILENRIQQSEHKNDVFKKTITIVLTLLGIKALYSKVNLWNLIFENTKLSFQSALLPAVRIGMLLLVVSVFIETYDCLINNSVKLEKWYVLLNHANKLKIESKRSQN